MVESKKKEKKKKPLDTMSLKDFNNLVDLEQQERQSSVGEGERTERGGSGTGNCWDQQFQRSVGSQRPNLPERLVVSEEDGRDDWGQNARQMAECEDCHDTGVYG